MRSVLTTPQAEVISVLSDGGYPRIQKDRQVGGWASFILLYPGCYE